MHSKLLIVKRLHLPSVVQLYHIQQTTKKRVGITSNAITNIFMPSNPYEQCDEPQHKLLQNLMLYICKG